MRLKQRILANPFADDIRELRINRSAYEELCQAIRALTIQWHGKKLIDKELAADLYAIVAVTENIADRLKEWNDDRAAEVAEMAHELDGLVLECFGS
jgi:hypothetical protein